MKDNYIHSNWSHHVMFFREQFLRSSEHESMVKFSIIEKLQSVYYHNIFISVHFSSEKSRGIIIPRVVFCQSCRLAIFAPRTKLIAAQKKIDVRVFKKRSV